MRVPPTGSRVWYGAILGLRTFPQASGCGMGDAGMGIWMYEHVDICECVSRYMYVCGSVSMWMYGHVDA